MKLFFVKGFNMLKKIPELISRIMIGYVFIESGIGKFQNIANVVSYFESLKIPLASIQAPMVATFELIFGIFILLGFFTRLSTLPLIGIMTVALITAKAEDITSFSSLIGISEFLYIVILIWLTANGSSVLSIDSWRSRSQRKESCQR
jgi:putative oxidoreductase